jgi:hypothetical protein
MTVYMFYLDKPCAVCCVLKHTITGQCSGTALARIGTGSAVRLVQTSPVRSVAPNMQAHMAALVQQPLTVMVRTGQ